MAGLCRIIRYQRVSMEVITIIRWILGSVSLAFGAFLVAHNAKLFYCSIVRGEEVPSVVPLLGGVFASLGLFCLPASIPWACSLLPLILDWGGLPGLLAGWWQRTFR